MSIVPVTFDIDVSKIQGQVAVVKSQAAQLKASNDQQRINVMATWAYFNQIASLSLNMLGKAAEGTAAQAAIAGIVSGLQIAQAEATVIQTLLQASGFVATSQYGRATALFAIAALMQTSIVTMIINRQAQRAAADEAEELARQIATYRS